MPKNPEIKKVLVIGSGPIVIGQAAEFDYAGTQACRSLKEEGIEVVLLNSNPATIMTDKDIADRVYIEPLTVDEVAAVRALLAKAADTTEEEPQDEKATPEESAVDEEPAGAKSAQPVENGTASLAAAQLQLMEMSIIEETV